MKNKKGVMALSQIFILIIGVIAIGYAFGSEFTIVEATGSAPNPANGNGGTIGSPASITIPKGIELKGETFYKITKTGEFQYEGTLANGVSKPLVVEQHKILADKGYINNINGEFTKQTVDPSTITYGQGILGNFAEGVVWAAAVVTFIQLFGNMAGIEQEQLNAASISAASGIIAGKTLYGLALKSQWGKDVSWSGYSKAGTYSTIAGAAIAVYMFYEKYRDSSTETAQFDCNAWDAPTGGNDCEKCNRQGLLPCSEYQCRSLGQSCQLLNPGTSEEKCAWVNRNDVNFPIIKPWDGALLDDYRYTPDNAISPPDRGVKILYEESENNDFCLPAFTPMRFGIVLDEPGQCKLDYQRKDSFEEMDFNFGGTSLYRYNHTQIMSLPGSSNLDAENITILNDGNYSLYVRCQDSNGNANVANFVFKYCVDKGPDTTPPLIVTTSLLNNMPFAFNQTEIDLSVYVNEPANCKWSRDDQSYENMLGNMSCSNRINEINAQMLYTCSTTLPGLKDREENKFYFRCEDQPRVSEENRNKNQESYEFTLLGTQPLVIDSVEPNGTVRDSTDVVKVTLEVETSAGHDEGKSTCYYSNSGEEGSYVMFLYKGADDLNYEHSQDLHLPEGDYEYFIRCIDRGGNSNTTSTQFDIESDDGPPTIVRAYHEDNYLKVITHEKAECVYNDNQNDLECNYLFEDGNEMSVTDDANHFIDWSTETDLFIKCKDEFGNQPSPDQCSIIVRALDV